MGAQLSTVAPTATVPIDAYVSELGDLAYVSDLGKSRFLKTTKAMHRDGTAVVKVFIKPNTAEIDIGPVKDEVKAISENLRHDLGPLNEFPNAIGYSRIVETERAGYLVRQFIKHNLYDRISTRPFLEPIEKKWIAYQLLRALQTCHEHKIYHGDIKSENILVGSWKWIYLVDFAPFKPVKLPETDTAQFLFYFDVSQRRACYVAPERFSDDGPDTLNSAMDVYAAGCVIGEMFLDGQPLFTLADLFKYKRGEYSPNLDSIGDPDVQNLVLSMVDVDPAKRLSADEYLHKFRNTVFPDYFDTFWNLFVPFSGSAGSTNSDEMVEHLWDNFESTIMQNTLNLGDDAVEHNTAADSATCPLPVIVTLPQSWWVPRKRNLGDISASQGMLIVLSFICSALTSTSTVEWRLRAAKMVLVLAEFVNDDIKLDRCLPHLVQLLRDPQLPVKRDAISLITHLMSMVTEYSALNSKVYTAYLFPRISKAVSGDSPVQVRAMYASCLAELAQCAVKCESWESVVGFIDDSTRFLLIDKVAIVRRCLLENANELCIVLRKQGTNDIILSHVITYLNDKDPLVRMDLFRFIARVAPLIGLASVEQYMIPLLIQSLCDPREDITALVLQSIAAMVEVGLIRLKTLLGLVVPVCSKFLIHPNVYIRTQTLLLLANSAKQLSNAQVYCLMRPLMTPYLMNDAIDYKNPSSLMESLRQPISQSVYSLALNWAMQATKSTFWTPASSSSSGTITFSKEDSNWLARLREVGFNNEDLWQLLAFRDYLWQLSLMPSASSAKYSGPDSVNYIEAKAAKSDISANENGRLVAHNSLARWKGGPIPLGLEHYVESLGATEDEKLSQNAIMIDSQWITKTTFVSKAAADSQNKIPSNPSSYSAFDGGVEPLKWSPPSVLVNSMKAHRGAIKVLFKHPNNRLFVTAADDGLVNIWDAKQLLKGSSKPLSQVTLDGAITAGNFLGDSSILIIATRNGAVTFLDCAPKSNQEFSGTAITIESIEPIAKYKLDIGFAVGLHTTNLQVSGSRESVWILQSTGSILRLNLASLKVTMKIECPREHGSPLCWAWDTAGDWVTVGTSHGMIELFDVRFGLRVNSWGIGDLQPIMALELHPTQSLWICASGGFTRNLVSVRDIQKVECRELLVPLSDLNQDGENDNKLPSLNPIPATQQSLQEKFAAWNINETYSRAKPPVATMVSSTRPGSCHLLTGGGDKILRYWNLQSPHLSAVISGTRYNAAKLNYMGKVGSAVKYTYETTAPVKSQERLSRTAIIELQDRDISRNHRGNVSKVALLELSSGRDLAVSVDEVGVIKVFT